MSKRIEQTQLFCNRCDQPTLHQRQATETNHVLHLLLSLFCCLLWLPVWVLIAFVNSMERTHYLCTRCGQPVGVLTPEQLTAIAQERRFRSAERARQRSIAVSAAKTHGWRFMSFTAGAGTAGIKTTLQGLKLVAVNLTAAGIAAWPELKRLPARTDRVLKVIAGEGNDILFWFLRIATVAVLLGSIVGLFVAAVAMIAAIFGPRDPGV